MNKLILVFSLLLFYQSCFLENKKSKNIFNKKIVIGKSVGSIEANMTLDDLKSIYGNENIKQIIYDNQEGIDIYGTEIIFPNQKNNIIVLWNYEKKVDKVIIKNNNSEWNVEGIKIGSTISQVQKLNKYKFIIYGYEIDLYMAGTVKSWGDGEFIDLLNIQFELTKDINYKKIEDIKETYFSDEDIILDAKPVVSKIFLSFENLD